MALPRSKLALIHVAKKKLGMDDATYRVLLQQVADVSSAKDLDEDGFEAVLGRLGELGFKTFRQERSFGERPGMATPDQIEYIRSLWKQFTGKDNETSLNHWLENQFGITALRFADNRAAHQALTALKAMNAR